MIRASLRLSRHALMRWCLVLPLLFMSLSCAQLRLPGQFSDVTLNLNVTAADIPGVYRIAGETNLPDKTQLTIAAVRQLSLKNSAAANFKLNPTYSILAYQPVTVTGGKWSTQLNLWQVAPNGKYQETWQLEQTRLGLSLQPAEEVIFLATLTPPDKLSRLEQQLADRGMRLAGGTVLSTPDGQRYAQVNQVIAVALPTGETSPPIPQADEVNYGWGYRYLIPQEPQNPYTLEFPKERQTNAPPQREEFLQ
jgi:hypothetical protein